MHAFHAEETSTDVESSLKALAQELMFLPCPSVYPCLLSVHLQLEANKAREAEAEATATKQRMLNIEKAKIKDIVRKAFAPLHGA